METIHIVKGEIQNEDALEAYGPGYAVGDIEWQFSDGPSGSRGSSGDFADLRKGLMHYGYGVSYDVSEADFTADERAVFDALMSR